MKRYIDSAPRWINAKFASQCAETNKAIAKGERCLYYPSTRKVYCADSATAKDWESAEFDRKVLGYEY